MEDPILFGAIAAHEKFVTTEQLEAALAEQRGAAEPRRIGEILKARGLLTDDQVQIILDIQRVNVADRVESPQAAGLFGQVAIRAGFCTGEDVTAAVRQQSELAADGRRVRIGRILNEAGRLAPDQLVEVLRQQEKFVVKCPGCSRWTIVDGLPQNTRFFCRPCLRVVPIPVLPGTAPDAVEFAQREAGGQRVDRVAGDAAERFGHFVVETEIMRTTASAMFRAVDPSSRRPVTLRLLQAKEPPTPARMQEFRRASEPVATLVHDHLAEFVELGLVEGRPYVATEYLDGASLASVFARRKTPRTELVRFLEMTARALGHAHRHGVVHGALRPASVLVGHRFEPRVIDVGLAPLLDRQAFLARDPAPMGAYLAPEVAAGRAADAPSDVYSLGVILYEALGGRAPRASPSSRGPAEPLPGDVPQPFKDICARATSRHPWQRYAHAAAMADDLKAAIEGKALARRPARWRVMIVIAGLVAALAVLVWLTLR